VHELSLAQHLLDLALEHAARAGADRITHLNLVVGELAPVEPSCLTFYWEQVAADTAAAGSSVDVRRLPLRLLCQGCNLVFEPAAENWSCPKCSSDRVRLQGGDECYLEAIDVEVDKTLEAPA
jgi:hydrogenase nickel incorporation protein HypA/HybF